MSTPSFHDLGLSSPVLSALEQKGFKTPSPIQIGVIPLLLKGEKDIVGQAQTGTGKTAAFALPLLERLDSSRRENQALILAPTRELAIQVAKEINSFSVPSSPQTAVVYGGNSLKNESMELRRKPHIIVGTPGRMQHHIRNRNITMDTIRYFVLDEADEMLNFGFREEIEEMLALTPPQRKVLLFSATMPSGILRIAKEHMKEYDVIKVEAKEMTNENITQKYYCLKHEDKFEALCRVMEMEEHFYAIVFCRTKSDTDLVASQLSAKHLRAEALHGDIEQNHREKILGRFKGGKTNILVATDVAARGIDIAALNFVVNYSLPENYEIYTHRIGRTGRAGNKGTAVTFITRAEAHRLRFFEKNLKTTIEKGVLPKAEEIIEKKKSRLLEEVEHIILNENCDSLKSLADLLLEEGEASSVVMALLKQIYGDSFNPNGYRTIADASPKHGDRQGGFRRDRNGGGGNRGRHRNGGGGGRGRGGDRYERSDRNEGGGYGGKRRGGYGNNSYNDERGEGGRRSGGGGKGYGGNRRGNDDFGRGGGDRKRRYD